MEKQTAPEMNGSYEGISADLHSPRVREVFKYLPEWAPKNEATSAKVPTLSPDVTLNSFAQLIALRLNVDRSLISFLDGEEQYVLAEATQGSLLQRGRLGHDENRDLMRGLQTFPSRQGLCYQALLKVPVNGILVVKNIHENKDFCYSPFAQSAPDIKFYVACPIIINEQKVGIVCVIDQNPRASLTSDEVNFLSDVSSAVAQHLESIRLQKTHVRSSDIVAALDAVMRPDQRTASFQIAQREQKVKSHASNIETSKDNVSILSEPSNGPPLPPPSPKTPFNLSSNFLEYAGSLLVDGFDADGVVFYDAGSRTYTSGSSRRSIGFSSTGASIPSSPIEVKASGFEELNDFGSPACKILAFSKGSNREDYSVCIGHLQEKNLRDLLEIFPTGHILHVGDLELSSRSGIENSDNRDHPSQNDTKVSRCLRQALPDAQSIIFFPMWDHFRERWYAGGFLYSSNAKRLMFTTEDLNFLQAFALVLTGELASRDQERSHNQKETFISMISHELRTPLHGILSNVDLMRDIGLTTFQTTLLDTISACGHSLMDIINHLIDRSTMAATDENFKKHHQLTKKHRRAPLRRATSYDKTEEVDLVIVTEEVISALAVEMHLRAEARQGYEEVLKSSKSSAAQDLLPSNAVVVYDIHPQHNWNVKVSKGAYRRLLANLTSNAIKFTREGTIQIVLQREDPGEQSMKCTVTLEVIDTGEGISSEFLKHHLFQQFQQENTRTIGSGLGLFIVKSMTDELDGNIIVKSTKGAGTFVSVSFPCQLIDAQPATKINDGPEQITSYADSVLQQVKLEAHRITVCFVRTQYDERPEQTKAGLDHSRSSIALICKNWFGIKVEYSTTLKTGSGMVNLVDESYLDSRPFEEILQEMTRNLSWVSGEKTYTSPVIFIGTVNFTAALQKQPQFEAKENMFSITNPCGPHQLARVLTSCMKLMLEDFQPEATLTSIDESLAKFDVSSDQNESQKTSTQAVFMAQPHILVANSASEPVPKTPSPQAPISTQPIPSDPPSQSRKPHMLLVEDNAINMKVLERLCTRLSLTYALAFNGEEAVTQFQKSPCTFDLIWMDIMMPVLDGIAAAKRIREIEAKNPQTPAASRSNGESEEARRKRVRIVALTGLSGEDIETDAEASGFDGFYTKPVKLNTLKKEVEAWARLNDQES